MSTVLKKAIQIRDLKYLRLENIEHLWRITMIGPMDYAKEALRDKNLELLMNKVSIEHGGNDYDLAYPEGLPTRVIVKLRGEIRT